MRRRQTNDFASGGFPRPDACRCVFDDQNGRTGRQPEPGSSQQVAVRGWFPNFDVLGHDEIPWLRQLQHIQPTRPQRSRPRRDDGPGSFRRLEGGEELTGTRDLLRILTILSRDEAFDVADVYSIAQCSHLHGGRGAGCRSD